MTIALTIKKQSFKHNNLTELALKEVHQIIGKNHYSLVVQFSDKSRLLINASGWQDIQEFSKGIDLETIQNRISKLPYLKLEDIGTVGNYC